MFLYKNLNNCKNSFYHKILYNYQNMFLHKNQNIHRNKLDHSFQSKHLYNPNHNTFQGLLYLLPIHVKANLTKLLHPILAKHP